MTFHTSRFDRAAQSYGRHSRIQEHMAEVLLGLVPEDSQESGNPGGPARVLEMGCGTGLFTRRLRLRFPRSHMLVTDASPRMLAEASRGLAGLAGPAPAGRSASAGGDAIFTLFDADGRGGRIPAPVMAAAPFDLVSSNALAQWFQDLRAHLRLVSLLVASGGRYLVSAFSRDNFPELNDILREPPFGYHEYPGCLPADMLAAAESMGLMLESSREEILTTTFPNVEEFLEAIRGLGSSRRPEAGKPLTRGKLDFLKQTYRERYSGEGGIRVTWKPWYALLRKR